VDELKLSQQDLPTALKTMGTVEYDHIVRILELTDWNVSGKNGAAEILGLKHGTLRARMQKLVIRKPYKGSWVQRFRVLKSQRVVENQRCQFNQNCMVIHLRICDLIILFKSMVYLAPP
jgi:hypothetical protein